MKKIVLYFSLLFHLSSLSTQEWCDSTLITCDSVFIDSIIFAEFPTTGSHVVFQITMNHDFLYAPDFIVCSDYDNIDFPNNDYPYFSIFGPSNINPSYGYIHTDITEPIFSGSIIVDNSYNSFDNCVISFSTIIPTQSTNIEENIKDENIKIFPNPVQDHLFVQLKANHTTFKDVVLFDVLGQQQVISFDSYLIDVSLVSKGIYILQIELNNGELFSEKIMINE